MTTNEAVLIQMAVATTGPAYSEATFLSVSAGDWLQALSGMMGVCLTVLVTLWIERRRRRNEERADLKVLDKAVRNLQGALEECEKALPADADLQTRIGLAQTAQELLFEAHLGYEFARKHTLVRDLNVYRELRYLDGALAGVADQIAAEYGILAGNSGRATAAVLDVNQSKIATVVARLAPFVDRAAATLRSAL